MSRTHMAAALAVLGLLTVPPAAHAARRPHQGRKTVAYDAKDRRYYSVAWAKAHGMHDKGGDPLTVVPMSRLPRDAQESRAMHGARM